MTEKILSPRWVTDKFILIMLAVFPLFTGFSGYSNITLSKYLFFVIVTLIWLVFLAAGILKAGEAPRLCAGGAAVIALMAIACASALFSPYGAVTLIGAGRYDGLVSLLLYGAIFIGVSAYGRPLPRYAAALGLSLGLCCLVAVFQLCGANTLKLFSGGLNYYDKGVAYSAEFLGTIGNVDVLAALLCLAVPILFGAFACKGGKYSWLYLVPAALGLFTALKSGVASAKLGLAAGIIVGGLILINKDRLRRLSLCAVIIAAVIAISGFTRFYDGGVKLGCAPEEVRQSHSGTMYEIKEILSGNIDDSFGSGRIGIWRQLLEKYPDRPILGGGPGTVSERVEINFQRFVPETGRTLKTRVDNAHNEFLGYLMDLGALGFLAYLALVVTTLLLFIKRRNSQTSYLGCGLMGYCVQSFFGLGLCLVLPVVWLCWGLFWSGYLEENHGRSNLQKTS